ncbi:MAG: acetamidase/formamidase family protein [Firmicutes bacterium]|nr:acetamidase/formamidase family protein [Bacillota bacterium]
MYIPATAYSYVFSAENSPVARVTPPTSLTFKTLDCSTDRVKSPSDLGPDFIPITEVNPVTGPVYIEGAAPGDALAITIDAIRLGPQAHIKLIPENGICRHRVRSPATKICRIQGDEVDFSPAVKVPIRPMVGTIGTAPLGKAIPTVYGGSHGGNLDNNLIAPGATIYLPVFVPGALLAVGDLHARMGDGELGGIALETNGEVDLRVRLVKGVNLVGPFGENAEVVFACAFIHGPWEAIEEVSARFADLLVSRFGLTLEEAVMLISAAGDLRLCQCQPGVDDIGISARIEMPREILGLGPEDRLF